jgi:hypothetical protein
VEQEGKMTATKQEIYAARTLSQLQALERKHGYAFGWANKIHQARRRKRDGSNGSGEPRFAVVQEKQNQNKEDERRWKQGVARPPYLYSHYSNMD